jgi:hypothetical protein
MRPSGERPPEMDSMVESRETLVTIEFRAQGSSTEVVLTHEYFADQPPGMSTATAGAE